MMLLLTSFLCAAALAAAVPGTAHRILGEGCPFCAGEYQDSCEACTGAGGIWQSAQATAGVVPCDASCDDWAGMCVHTVKGCNPGAGPCAVAMAQLRPRDRKPSCDDNGDYMPVQCDDVTIQACWCSDADGGEIGGSRVPNTRVLDVATCIKDKPVELCTPNPCQNGGSCAEMERVDAYSCMCAAGFEGTDCSVFDDTPDSGFRPPDVGGGGNPNSRGVGSLGVGDICDRGCFSFDAVQYPSVTRPGDCPSGAFCMPTGDGSCQHPHTCQTRADPDGIPGNADDVWHGEYHGAGAGLGARCAMTLYNCRGDDCPQCQRGLSCTPAAAGASACHGDVCYGTCEDVDECAVGASDCLQRNDERCVNTPGGFECEGMGYVRPGCFGVQPGAAIGDCAETSGNDGAGTAGPQPPPSPTGNPECWSGAYTYGRCCAFNDHPGVLGDPSCWSGRYTYQTCCASDGH